LRRPAFRSRSCGRRATRLRPVPIVSAYTINRQQGLTWNSRTGILEMRAMFMSGTRSLTGPGSKLSPISTSPSFVKEGRMERPNNSSIRDEFHIYYSKRRILLVVLRGSILIAFFAAIVWASLSDWQLEAPLSRVPSAELWFLLLFIVGLLSWFTYRPLRQFVEALDTRNYDEPGWHCAARPYADALAHHQKKRFREYWLRRTRSLLCDQDQNFVRYLAQGNNIRHAGNQPRRV